MGGKQITGFVGLRSKLYAYKVGGGLETKKCKGVKKGVVERGISFEDYNTCSVLVYQKGTTKVDEYL